MFQSIGPGELMTIGLIALIVFGPHRLPDMARKIGGYVRDLRAAASEIRQGLDAEVRSLKEPLDAVRQDLTKPVSEIKQSLTETADAVKESADPAADALNRTVSEVRDAGKVQWVGTEPPKEAKHALADAASKARGDASTEALDRTVEELRGSGKVEWVGAEPQTGVSPSEAWKGLEDPVPDDLTAAPTEITETEPEEQTGP